MTDSHETKNRRVLVIDDNRAIHDDFRKILSPDLASKADFEASDLALFGEPAEAVEQARFEISRC